MPGAAGADLELRLDGFAEQTVSKGSEGETSGLLREGALEGRKLPL